MKLAAVCLAAAAVCLAAPKVPITHEELWGMRRVEAPVPSPDGKWVIVGVTEPAYDEKNQNSDLWILSVDGTQKPRKLTQTKGGESAPAWSPDSTRIAFSAKREGDEAAQIYILDIAVPGEAARVTSALAGASSPQFSPDGRLILYQSNVYPGAADEQANRKIAEERKARKYNARVYQSFPIRHWDKWLDDMQRTVFVQSLEPGAKAVNLLAGTKLVAGPGFAGTSTNSGQDLEPVWTPDSKAIVFVATDARNQAAYAQVTTDLYEVTATGGEPRKLTETKGSYSKPRFTPDGKTLLCLMDREQVKPYGLERLVSFSWPMKHGTGPVTLTESLDRAVGAYAITPDSRTVYFTAEDAGLEKLYRASLRGGEIKAVGDSKTGGFANLSIPGKASTTLLVANFDSATNPPEVAKINSETGAHTLLTGFNVERAAKLDLPPLRHFWFTDSKGKKIHSMLALPPAFEETKKYPLLVLLHGGPHSMWGDRWVIRWNYHLLAKPGYVVLLTNYTGSTGFGEKFAQAIQGDPLAGPGREVNEAADAAIAKFSFIDGSRQAAAGASYGGHLANWLQATTTRYKCLVSHAGLINLESQWGTSDTIYHRELGMGGPVWEQGPVWREQNPIRFAVRFKTPMLLTVGENDFRVPLNQTLENWSVLQRLKVPSKLIVFPDENHWIQKGENSRFWYGEVHEWLAKWLNSETVKPSSGGL